MCYRVEIWNGKLNLLRKYSSIIESTLRINKLRRRLIRSCALNFDKGNRKSCRMF